MNPRIRKLIGTVFLLVVLLIYSLLVMVAAASVLPSGGKITELIFYAIAGVAWIFPAGLVIRWMYATPRSA